MRDQSSWPPGTRTPNPRIKSPLFWVLLLPDNVRLCRFVSGSAYFTAA